MSEGDQVADADSSFSPMLTHLRVTVRGTAGYVFRAREPGAFCFVPAQCVHATAVGGMEVDEIAYLADGWGTRNSLRSDAEVTGRFLFPDAEGGVMDPASPEVGRFLGRFA